MFFEVNPWYAGVVMGGYVQNLYLMWQTNTEQLTLPKMFTCLSNLYGMNGVYAAKWLWKLLEYCNLNLIWIPPRVSQITCISVVHFCKKYMKFLFMITLWYF